MTGKLLKSKLEISIKELSELLGYTEQRLHSALKSNNIKSNLIEDIARVTNKSVCYYYNIDTEKIIGVQNNAKGGNVQNNSDCKEALKILNEQLKTKDDQIKMLIEKIK